VHAPNAKVTAMHRTDKAVVASLGLTAAITGTLSYAGLRQFADNSGQSLPELWPFALDVPAAALSLAVWRAHTQGRQAFAGRIAVDTLVLLSAALQVSAADLTRPVPVPAIVIGHALPACVFAVLWETLLWLRRTTDTPETSLDLHVDAAHETHEPGSNVVYDARRPVAPAPTVKPPAPVTPAVTAAPVHAVPVPVDQAVVMETPNRPSLRPDRQPSPPTRRPRKTTAKKGGPEAAIAAARTLLDNGHEVTPQTLADAMGTSIRTGYRWMDRPEIQTLISQSDQRPVPHALDSSGTLAPTGTREDRASDTQLSATDSAVSPPSGVSSVGGVRVPVGAG
jgi:hypothetical protein